MLISNSFSHGKGYLEHCANAIKLFLKDPETPTVTFIPYAWHDHDAYLRLARTGFGKFGIRVLGVQEKTFRNHREAVSESSALFVGGGNTFRLLDGLYRHNLIEAIQHLVRAGVPYLGVSAGANVACPTIKTTNDMPIVEPLSLDALGIFPYQINPHYLDADPASKHMGETREKRIAEFHEENDTPVIGLREGSWIETGNVYAKLCGVSGARVFAKGGESTEMLPGSYFRADICAAAR